MATVYLARRAGVGGFQRFVAVKRLHPHLANESDFVQMFLDEARLAALIHHPNVVSISEVGASDRGYYLVMDYIEGDTLARLMNDTSEAGRVVPLGVALRIIIDMLTGLHAAHDLHDEQGNPTGLVHRDVSPQNVLVGLDGISRISDFGVAHAASRLAGTRVGQLKGKIAYMAPEQAAGDDMLDRRADVFASGILLWELLTGRRLFRATNDAATLSRVVNEKIDPPIRYVEGLEPRISDVCMKALERPLSRRIASAGQFAEMVEAAAVGAGVLVTGREVAAYMQLVLGEEVTRQREAVRRWVGESESAGEEPDEEGVGSASGSQPRHDRNSIRPGRSSGYSRTRPLLSRDACDSDPADVTVVARPPRFFLVPTVLGCLLLLATIVVGVLLLRSRADVLAARKWRQVQVPTQLFVSSSAGVQTAAAQSTDESSIRTGALSTKLSDGFGQAVDARGAATQPSASTRNQRFVLPNGTSGRMPGSLGSSDVDLSNPYR
jgi:serine/threonine protein kinase